MKSTHNLEFNKLKDNYARSADTIASTMGVVFEDMQAIYRIYGESAQRNLTNSLEALKEIVTSNPENTVSIHQEYIRSTAQDNAISAKNIMDIASRSVIGFVTNISGGITKNMSDFMSKE